MVFGGLLAGAERTMLNIMQRMSGMKPPLPPAIRTPLKGLKTLCSTPVRPRPEMRMLEKEAVKIYGGTNHRIGLFSI